MLELDDPPDLPDFPDPDPPLLPDFPLLELDGFPHGLPHDGLPHPQSQSSEELDDYPPDLPDFPDDDDEQSNDHDDDADNNICANYTLNPKP